MGLVVPVPVCVELKNPAVASTPKPKTLALAAAETQAIVADETIEPLLRLRSVEVMPVRTMFEIVDG